MMESLENTVSERGQTQKATCDPIHIPYPYIENSLVVAREALERGERA
jgi:hypothetical protein